MPQQEIIPPKTLLTEGADVQPTGTPNRYYIVGRRPLDMSFLAKYFGKSVGPSGYGLDIEHQHFIGSDGSNFGFGLGGVFTESPEELSRYSYDTTKHGGIKYNADCIDQAKEEVAEDLKRLQNTPKIQHFQGDPTLSDPSLYQFLQRNCQHYISRVLERAERIAQKKGVNLILEDKPDRNTPSGKNARTSKQLSEEIDPGKILYPDMR